MGLYLLSNKWHQRIILPSFHSEYVLLVDTLFVYGYFPPCLHEYWQNQWLLSHHFSSFSKPWPVWWKGICWHSSYLHRHSLTPNLPPFFSFWANVLPCCPSWSLLLGALFLLGWGMHKWFIMWDIALPMVARYESVSLYTHLPETFITPCAYSHWGY